MKRYEAYRPTKYEWLTEVPTHWQTRTMRSLTTVSSERRGNREATLLSVYREYGVIVKSSRDDNHNVESEDLSNYKWVRTGDLVMNKMKMWQGSLGVSEFDGIVSPAYIVCHINDENVNRRYLHMLLRSPCYKTYYNQFSYGIRVGQWDMHYEDFKGLEVALPPREEQDQIVRYLDWQMSKINRLIAAKRKQIGLLKEQERSVAVHYITHGCNPQAVMKDSGIDWVEMIPQHWDVLFLQQVAEERFVKNAGMLEDDLLSLSYGHIIRKDINTTDGLLPASFEGYQIVEKDDTVLRLTDLQNDHRSLRTGLVLERGIITSAYTCIKPRKNILPEYLQLQLHSADLCKVFYGLGGGVRQSIGYKDIRKLLMFVPPLEEQQEILDAIKRESASSLPCYNKLEEEITVLQELRTRLISDVVTGQIDVRDVEIPDFEYISETDDNGEETDDEKSDDMAEEEV